MKKADISELRGKAAELVSQMTLEEKAKLTSGAEMFRTEAIERLGVPAFNLSDGPFGLRKQTGEQDFAGKHQSAAATCFPAACATGSGFDPELVYEMGKALGKICQAEDVQVLLGPGINIKRSPLCGRNFEYFSEDPYVSGTLGAAYVKGVQSEGVGTSVKHFFANSQETRRRTQSADVDERAIREIYTPAFEKVIQEAEPWTVMSSYNRVNGRYVNESPRWCLDLLRKDFGFEGMTVSDWAAVHDRTAALAGGTDLAMPADRAGDQEIAEAVRTGKLNEADLERACRDIVTLALCADAEKKGDASYDFEKAHALARKIAGECMVLLKNEDHILPLSGDAKIAVIGGFAAHPRYQGAGSSRVNAWKVPSLQEVTKGRDNIVFAEGYGMGDVMDGELQEEAVSAAENADAAVILAGLPPVMESEGFDRWVMKLPRCQNALIEKICAVQQNTIVVLENGGAVELPWAEKPKAILEAYLAGEAVNEALWDVLTGKTAPSGHLAETFPLRYEDTPAFLSWPGEGDHTVYDEGVFVGYRWYTTRKIPVRYPFGYGLTYTEFAYTGLKADSDSFRAGDNLKVSVAVTNTGSREGKALVQLYVGAPLGSNGVRCPVRELKGFQKADLQPGESRRVEFILDKRSFAHWDTNVHDWRVFGGEYTIGIGNSAEDIVLSCRIHAETEYIPDGKVYTILTSIGEVQQHPEGKKFLEEVMPQVNAVIRRMSAQGSQEAMPYAEEMPEGIGLMSEPMQTLKRMLPGVPQERWDRLFRDLNGREAREAEV